MVAAEVVLGQILGLLETPGQEAPSERAVGDEAHLEFAAGGQYPAFRVAAPQRVLGLKSGDGMHGARPSKGRRRCLGQSQVADLAGPHQFRHGADGLLDRRGGVDAMLVIEVDDLDPESLEAGLARFAHVLGPSVDPQKLALRRRGHCRTSWRGSPARGARGAPGQPVLRSGPSHTCPRCPES